ncbi:hypothetical protein Tco_1107368 [Tanacetum coccineum]
MRIEKGLGSTKCLSMKNMNEKPGMFERPENGFYEKLNALKFVPQQELSREQAYWLPANEIASNASNPATPVTPFVHNRPPPSQVLFHLQKFRISLQSLISACDREHTKVLELEAEVLKQQKMVTESAKRNSYLQQNHIDLQLKFQNYKQCIDTSSASNAIFEINKLRKQLQGKDDTIRNLDAQNHIIIQIDGYKEENVNLKRRYEELSKSNAYSRSTFVAKRVVDLQPLRNPNDSYGMLEERVLYHQGIRMNAHAGLEAALTSEVDYPINIRRRTSSKLSKDSNRYDMVRQKSQCYCKIQLKEDHKVIQRSKAKTSQRSRTRSKILRSRSMVFKD